MMVNNKLIYKLSHPPKLNLTNKAPIAISYGFVKTKAVFQN